MRKYISCLMIVSYLLVLVVISGCQVLSLSGPAVSPTSSTSENFQWDLRCSRMGADGAVIENLTCTLTAILQTQQGKDDVLYLKLDTPEDYPFCIPNLDNYTTDLSNRSYLSGCPYFASMTYGYSKAENKPHFCHFAVDFEKQCLIAYWDDTQEYLVCTANENGNVNEAFEHFEAFRNSILMLSVFDQSATG